MAGPESRAMFTMLNMGELAGTQELQTTKTTKRGSYDGVGDGLVEAVQRRF